MNEAPLVYAVPSGTVTSAMNWARSQALGGWEELAIDTAFTTQIESAPPESRNCRVNEPEATVTALQLAVQRGYGAVTANKVPLTGPQAVFNSLARGTRSRRFRYESTVGSAVPIIEATLGLYAFLFFGLVGMIGLDSLLKAGFLTK